ncbi:MAG: T9SS type A sorting domain-containing protein [Balneolaceae bacterium]|nr:T9SS type A sorting domain-containing protein [Balneolaceae bacterium]
MNKRLQKFAMGILLSVFAISKVHAQNTEALEQTFDLEVTFEVNLAVQQELGVYDPEIHTPKIAGNFTSWQDAAEELTDQVDTSFARPFLFQDVTVDSVLEYKFILVDDDGTVTWESVNNRIYTVSGSETDSNGDDIADTTLTHFFNDLAQSGLGEPTDYDVTFTVDMRVQTHLGNFDADDGDIVGLVGNFNDWSTAEPHILTLGPESIYTIEIPFDQDEYALGSEIVYKFVIIDENGVYWEEPNPNPNEVGNRSFIFNGTEVDDDDDDRLEKYLPTEFFSNQSFDFYGFDVLFSVDMSAQDAMGNFKPDSHLVRLVGDFNDWNPETGQIMNTDDGAIYSTEAFITASFIDTVQYSFVIEKQDEFIWENDVTELGKRYFTFDGTEIDDDEDGSREKYIETALFNNQEFDFSPMPPYEVGDIINYNGSFALNNLGPVSGSNQGWLFETVNGPSVYEIVNDSQDDDGKAARVIVQFDGSEDVWRSQVVNEPIFPAEGDLYKVSMWLKSSVDGFASEAFLGLPGEGNFQEVNTHFFELGTEWEYYSFDYFASDVDADLGLRLGLKLNFESNDGDTVYIDNVQMEKIEAIFTPVTFSVNVAVQEALGNFDKGEHIVGLVGSFNGWDAGAPIVLEAELGDSVYTGTAEILNASIDDEIRYKFILKDDTTGVFQWEAPDPENPDTDGDFSDRITYIDDVSGMTVPTVYFHDIDRADLNIDNYDASPIIDARNSVYGTHLAVQGIVTRITNNFVYVQDETAATTLFSRPFFSATNSVNFNLATKSGEIQVGDELKVAGITADFNGLHEVINIHAWDVVSAGNPLPNPQLVDIDEYSNNGEEYESEVVRVERVRILDPVDSLKAGFVYEIVNEEETQIGWMSIQSGFNSDWAFQPAPQGFFNIEAVVKDFYIPSLDENIYAVSIHDFSDIEIIPDNFDAELSMISFAALPNTFETLNIDLIDLGDEPIQGMEFTINFDPNFVDVNLGDQSNTLLEGTTIITNKLEGQLIVAFATDGTPENDISEPGVLFNMGIDILAAGETEIFVSDISINEMPSPELYSFVNIVPRLCGDVTGDVTISTEDATLVLQHTVKMGGVFPLVELDSTAADVTGNGDISAFDASWILQKTVGLRDQLGCITLPLKEDQKPVSANWLLAESNSNESVVQLDVSQNEMEIYAIQMELDLSAGATFKSIRNLPDGWNIISNTTEDGTLLSLYGVKPFEGKTLDIEFNTANAQAVPKLRANIVLNERSVPEMDELVIGEVPSEFSLLQNYPNPFNPSTNIGYTLAEKADVELSIYNMLGQKVATVVNQTQEAGSYSITWQAGNLSSGVYIYQLKTGDKSFTKRMMLIK